MRKSIITAAVTIWAVTIGVLAAPQAYAEVDGYFYKSGSQCYDNINYFPDVANNYYPPIKGAMCRFWVPARFTQNGGNYLRITLKTNSSCYPKNEYSSSGRHFFQTLVMSYMYQPKDTSLWWDAAKYGEIDGAPGQFNPLLGEYGYYGVWYYYDSNFNAVKDYHLQPLSNSVVDQWWPRYITVYFYYIDWTGPLDTEPMSKNCIDHVEVFNLKKTAQSHN